MTTTSPSITLTPNSGPAGTLVTVTGSGFNTADLALCTYSSTPATLTSSVACTLSSGVISSTSFQVDPTVAPGTYILTVKGSTLILRPPFLPSLVPVFPSTPSSGPVGTVVAISGAGFFTTDVGCTLSSVPPGPPMPSAVTCTMTLGTGKIDAGATFTVATGTTPGTYTVTVAGTGGESAQATFIVTSPTPSIILSPSSGPVSVVVTVTGSGFNTADTGCTISSSPIPDITTGPPVSSCTITNGQVTGSFTVTNPAALGAHTIIVTGTPGSDFAQATFTVTPSAPSISLSPISGPVSVVVTVTGSGFNTADTGCTISVLQFQILRLVLLCHLVRLLTVK